MNVGNLSQTVWRRSVQKQLNIGEMSSLLPPVPGERCSAYRDMSGAIRIRAYAEATGKHVQTVKHAIWQAVNDLACRGGVACGVEVQVMFPVNAEEQDVKMLVSEAQYVCRQLGITLDSFQAQVNPAVACIIVNATVEGIVAERCGLVRMQTARPDLELVVCGFAGLSGSLQIAKEQREELQERFVPAFLRQMEALETHLSQYETVLTVQKVAQLREMSMAAKTPGNMEGAERFHIFAIQQAASGGIFAALWELAEAAGIGLEIDLKSIPVCQETVEICEYDQLNPYQMASTGCILFVTDQAERLIEVLEECGVRAGRLGITTAGNARVITSGEEKRYLERPAPDERMRFLMREFGTQQSGF